MELGTVAALQLQVAEVEREEERKEGEGTFILCTVR